MQNELAETRDSCHSHAEGSCDLLIFVVTGQHSPHTIQALGTPTEVSKK